MPTREIIRKALEIPPGPERAKYLFDACPDDADLRQLLESVLVDPSTTNVPDTPPDDDSSYSGSQETWLRHGESSGEQIGPYKLLQELGEGGMGSVWMAEQSQPVRRTVALKIIKAGMGSKEVIARFETERQALALMDHPNIARVLDAGETTAGRPYFVMELVKGEPITEFCDNKQIGLDERLELFASVCSAVQHAHQKGVIHRDIKPSNVLVTLQDSGPVVKVIDFGLAKATAQRLTERTLFTAFGQMVGTPAYMSPEQADRSGLDVDTRADVYSLGVLLYELMTGVTPLDVPRLREAGFAEIQRLIREEDPPRPSTRLSSLGNESAALAENRSTDPRRLEQVLRGDLDVIVMKALEKDRSRRYSTPNDFASDLGRYRRGEPIEARPASAFYKVRKFIQRHHVACGAGALVTLSLLAATVISVQMAVRARQAENLAGTRLVEARQQRDRAIISEREARDAQDAERTARQQAEAVSGFLVEAFRSPDPELDGSKITIAEVLDRSFKDLRRRFLDDPVTKAGLLEAIGKSYIGLGLYDESVPVFEQILTLRTQALGESSADTLLARQNLAVACLKSRDLERGIELSTSTLELMQEHLGDEHQGTLQMMNVLGNTLRLKRDFERAVPLLEEAWERTVENLGEDHKDSVVALNNLAQAYEDSGRLDEALPLFEKNLDLARGSFGWENPHTLTAMGNLAVAYLKAQQPEKAVPLLERTHEIQKSRLGAGHPGTILSTSNLAMAYLRANQPGKAVPLLDVFVAHERTRLGDESEPFARLLDGIGQNLARSGEYLAAQRYLKECLEIRRTQHGDHWSVFNLQSMVAGAMTGAAAAQRDDDPEQADVLFAEAEKALLSAHEGLTRHRDNQPDRDPSPLEQAVTRLVEFYQARSDPGDDSELARWKSELSQLEADEQ